MSTLAEPVVIGLGGNLGGEAQIVERFRRARVALARLGDLRAAPLYRTAPIGPAQPAYLNTAVRVDIADQQPEALIATLLALEQLLGRTRSAEARWGPRMIDLDVLVWGSRVIQAPGLEVPHPRLAERRFALEPLVVLLGEAFVIPAAGVAGALLERIRQDPAQHVEQLADAW
ncbi:MAG: 2-amino-4-hydroxy-6-hydroxymethyldihydropteridine pyrophosphokinase [Deltaproteobacteria bacterium]|nr:2-amino-4-hydroxy-6-hydroxymethyldihydropteridine pyrophosphokinase [Deltaproteobacteria bacterium]